MGHGTNWWEDFFDREYTAAWADAGAFDRTEEEVAAVLDLLALDGPADILDAPCGFGRHSGRLAAAGHRVTGVDASADQLALARERNPGPTYVLGDMGEPPPGPYDVVMTLVSSFGYRNDEAADLAVLRAWHDVLRPGGHVVIEGMHRDRMAAQWTGEPFEHGAGAVEHPNMDWVSGAMRSRLVRADGSERRLELRVYSATELVSMVRAAGFVDVVAHGGFERAPLSPQTRLLVHARRAA